jgi:SAM-dependent methyltransferase
LPAAGSITHQHLVAVLNTLLVSRPTGGEPIRILDVGVGDGRFLAYLLDVLPHLRPELQVECYGLDVDVWRVFEKHGRPRLKERHPGVDWEQRLALITPAAPWPFPDSFFDYITTNQVLEHVRDRGFFFSQLRRCLHPGGVSVHLFPVQEAIWEGHARMPVVHWLRDPWRRRAMRLFAGLGFDRAYREERARRKWTSKAEFARQYSTVLERDTHYVSVAGLKQEARAAGLRIGFTFTKDYYFAKLLSYFGLRPGRYHDVQGVETLLMLALRHVASITVLLMCDAPGSD